MVTGRWDSAFTYVCLRSRGRRPRCRRRSRPAVARGVLPPHVQHALLQESKRGFRRDVACGAGLAMGSIRPCSSNARRDLLSLRPPPRVRMRSADSAVTASDNRHVDTGKREPGLHAAAHGTTDDDSGERALVGPWLGVDLDQEQPKPRSQARCKVALAAASRNDGPQSR